MPDNFALTVFTQGNFVADFRRSAVLEGNDRFAFLSTLGGLASNVGLSSLAHWKAHSRLPISVN